MNNTKYIDVLLNTSKIFSDQISQFTQRIDRIRGIYFTAVFGLIGILLNPGGKPLINIISSIKADNMQIFLILLIPILNSILLIYIVSYMHFIYSAAKYNAYYIGNLISKEIGTEIIPFDNWETVVGDKEAWLTTRSIIGFMTFVIASVISISILYLFSSAGRKSNGTLNFIVYIFSLGAVSLSLIVGLVNHHIGKNYHVYEIVSKQNKIKRRYLFSIPLTGILYFMIVWIISD